jgi:hypothetical protein
VTRSTRQELLDEDDGPLELDEQLDGRRRVAGHTQCLERRELPRTHRVHTAPGLPGEDGAVPVRPADVRRAHLAPRAGPVHDEPDAGLRLDRRDRPPGVKAFRALPHRRRV